MDVITRPCPACGNKGLLQDVDALGFMRLAELGENPREALPDLDEEQINLLLFGIHAHCQERYRNGITFTKKTHD